MGLQGQLTKDKFGYSIPVNAPMYKPFPVNYKDAEVLSITYLTDPKAASKLLPDQLELADVPAPKPAAIAVAIFAHYPSSTVGEYEEVAQVLSCTYKPRSGESRQVLYAVNFHVTTDEAMTAGREIAGFPKKIGRIRFKSGETYRSSLERPAKTQICSCKFTRGKRIKNLKITDVKEYVSLRVIPNPEKQAEPSLCQLVGSYWELGPGKYWNGNAKLKINGSSKADPYHLLPVHQVVADRCVLFKGKMSAKGISFVQNL